MPNRTLVHSSNYDASLERLDGELKRLHDALTGVEWALSTNPGVYAVVKGLQDVRLAKTDPIAELPALRIWFKIESDNGQHVHLLEIEPIPEDE